MKNSAYSLKTIHRVRQRQKKKKAYADLIKEKEAKNKLIQNQKWLLGN